MGDTFGEEALISEAKRNATDHDADRRLPDAAVEAGFPHAAARAAAAVGRVGGGEAHRRRRRPMARRAPAVGVRPLSRRGLAQHSGAIAATEDEGPRPQRSLRRLLRHRPAQLRLRLPAVGARLPGERSAQRPARRGAHASRSGYSPTLVYNSPNKKGASHASISALCSQLAACRCWRTPTRRWRSVRRTACCSGRRPSSRPAIRTWIASS